MKAKIETVAVILLMVGLMLYFGGVTPWSDAHCSSAPPTSNCP